MKLVIDISEEDYKRGAVMASAIRKGIPLDNIKAEIIAIDKNVKAVRSDNCCFFTAEEVLEVIDRVQAESEK